MIKMRFTLLWVFTFLVGLASFAQQDPAVTNITLSPAPVTGGVGSAFTMTVTFGNNGPSPISGVGGLANRMQAGVTLGKIAPASANPLADLSGSALTYFDFIWNSTNRTYEGKQKQGVALPGNTLVTLVVSTTVTTLTTGPTSPDDIGGSVNIGPNGLANGNYDPSTGTGGNVTGNDFLSKYTRSTTTQPVSLVDFAAQAQDNRTVLINWSTSWERANKGYVIERSKDLKNFEQVGEVNDVAGTSNSVNKYRFIDVTPYRGTSYYRLRQLDLDGSVHTYDAKSVVIDGRYGVYPNPVVNQQFTLELDEPSTAVLRLFSASGSELGLGKSDNTEMTTKITPSTKLATGVYVLIVEERGTTRKHRLVVQ